MQGLRRLFCAICMSLILILACIHLGVSISIVVKFRNYGNIYRPERGLASFNIVIGTYGLLVGGFGLFAVLTDRGILCKVVAFATIVVAVFAFASLVTALVIHSLSIDYVSNRFANYMNNYQIDQDSTNIINRIQTSYVCCGTDTWLDWSSESLNGTGNSTGNTTIATTTAAATSIGNTTTAASSIGNTTTAATSVGNTTTAATSVGNTTTTATSVGNTTTAATSVGNTTTAATSVGNTTTALVTNTTTKATGRAVRNIEAFIDTIKSINDENIAGLTLFNYGMRIVNKNPLSSNVITNDLKFKRSPSQQTARRRRQTQTIYGGIYGLPSTFSVVLPQSCCTTDGSSLNSLANSYCISNSNNASSNLHSDGCSKEIAKRSIGQTIGLAVINSFLVVVAFASVAALFQKDPNVISSQHESMHPPASQYQPSYGPPYQQNYAHSGYHAPGQNFGIPYGNYNPTYSEYY